MLCPLARENRSIREGGQSDHLLSAFNHENYQYQDQEQYVVLICIFKCNKFKTNLQLIAMDPPNRRTSGGNRSGLSSPYENPPAPSPHQQPGTKTTSAPTSPLKVLKKFMLSIQSSFFVTFWLQMNLLKIIFALLPFLTVDLQERPESKKASFLGKVSSLSQVRCHI